MSISAALTLTDGPAAATSVTGTTFLATPANTLTIALTSTSGVIKWTVRCDSAGSLPGLNGFNYTSTNTFTTSLVLPNVPGTCTLTSEVVDGQNVNITQVVVSSFYQRNQSVVHRARNVVLGNISNLAAYTVAASTTRNDNILNVQGDYVLLCAQTTAAQNGLYEVGAVSSGTAPLTRVPDMPVALALPNGTTVEVSEGAQYGLSTWKATATTTGGPVIGTNDPAFYPRHYKTVLTMASGTATSSTFPFILSTTGSTVTCTLNTQGGTSTGLVQFAAPAASRVAGIAGTGTIVVNATKVDGTTVSGDTSTVDVLVTNW